MLYKKIIITHPNITFIVYFCHEQIELTTMLTKGFFTIKSKESVGKTQSFSHLNRLAVSILPAITLSFEHLTHTHTHTHSA
jgi:hypothetical protein